ncbi:CDP-alcohol phosphatidyltransferase family protein [Sulfuricystis multivorans]|uniref:CDP-alcohol phosphatidyltransferase family protein n=1 Tax=Sulfuricystis multivorans TaxID=2211108 RepID=UPI000F8494C7|nr:CDP-alcohol phosphatidyltransferase family protein [Sulfuricystis multivorans]
MLPNRVLTLPNIVTFIRLGLLPLLLWMLAARRFELAFWLFIAASVGDGLDGYLARRLDQHSRLGALLDPIADKLTILGIAWILAAQGLLPVWIAALMSLRDLVIVTGALAYRQLVGALEMAPTMLSKFNTLLEFLLLALVLMAQNRWIETAPWLAPLLGAVAVTIVASGAQYVWVWGNKARDHAHRH